MKLSAKEILLIVTDFYLLFKTGIRSFLYTHPPEQWKHGTRGDIILIPGFMASWYELRDIGNSLNEKGYTIHVLPEIRRNVLPIEMARKNVTSYIQKHNLQNITLLSHSTGGLVALSILSQPEHRKKIHYSISIATPYHGTLFGYLFILSLRELIPHSPLLRSLHEKMTEREKIINFYPKTGAIIIPNKSALLPGAKNICINTTGHLRIVYDAEVTRRIVKYLQ